MTNPEILLLDEVMAAGDAAFWTRAKSRMENLIDRAHVVVFASHSLGLLPSFCERTIWLDHGRLIQDGPTKQVIRAYKSSISPEPALSVNPNGEKDYSAL